MVKKIPAHVGMILDGNRRWAHSNGLPILEGHRRGAEHFKEIALYAFDQGINNLSAWVFSTENWSRTEEEVGYLMNMVVHAAERYLEAYNKANIKVVVVGRRQGLPEKVLNAIEKTEKKTADNTRGTLALCFNYGGQEELVDGFKSMVRQGIKAADISAETIGQNLYNPQLPPIDLVIRTSGELRTSGFMLWRTAYSELVFNKKYWPDFTTEDFDQALSEYDGRQRRFGK